MIFDKYSEYSQNWGNQQFWPRDYYVSTVENMKESIIVEQIKN